MKYCDNRKIIHVLVILLVLYLFLAILLTSSCSKAPEDNDITDEFEDSPNTNDPEDNTPPEQTSIGLSMVYDDLMEGFFVAGKGSSADYDIIIPKVFNELPVIGVLSNAFKNDSLIETVFLPKSIVLIDKYAFLGCINLIEVAFEEESGLKTIGEKAFSRCENLESISIPEMVEEIDTGCFSGCYSLSSITFPDSLYKVGSNVFEETIWLEEQGKGVIYAGKVAYRLKYSPSDPNFNLIIEDGSVGIADLAFFENSKIISMFIPISVKHIGYAAFSGCENLDSIVVDPNNQYFFSSNNTLVRITEGGDELMLGCGNSVIIPQSVKLISDYAFLNCKLLLYIDIPDIVSWIGAGAFKNCILLSDVELPGSIEYIAEQAFYLCTSINSFFVSSAIMEIKSAAFSGCTNLKTVFIDSNDVVSGLSGISAQGNILENAETIYINKSLTYQYGAYLLGHFVKQEISEYIDYYKYSIIMQ